MTITTASAEARHESTPALEESTLCAAFQRTASDRADEVALRTKGDETAITWGEYAARVRGLAEGFASLGVGRGDAVAMLLSNRPEFNVADTAAMHAGGVPFSIYAVTPPEQMVHMLGDAGARVAVTELALLPRLRAAVDIGAKLDHIVVVDGPGPDGAVTVEQLEAARSPGFDFEAAWRALSPNDLATLIYTSGTTGPPKGVEHTHASALAICRNAQSVLRLTPGGRVVSYMPSAHLADRCFSHWMAMALGLTNTSCPDPTAVVALLPEVRPTVFMSVPRVWQRMQAGVEAAMAEGAEGEWRNDSRVAASRIRRRLGLDACEAAIVTAAPSQAENVAFFNALGVPLRDGYAMSEIAPIAVSPLDAMRAGTVGPPVQGVELKLADDGEILVRGAALARGYRNLPEATAEAIDEQGWFHTGDVGALDDHGYLRIIDRKKELIISDAGKNMSPANIEAALTASSPLIGQACVIGDGRPHNVALITRDPVGAEAFARLQGLGRDDLDRPSGRELVRGEVAAAVERANERLAPHERIRRHLLLDREWLPGGAELTPTAKLRRRAIAERYSREIERLYE